MSAFQKLEFLKYLYVRQESEKNKVILKETESLIHKSMEKDIQFTENIIFSPWHCTDIITLHQMTLFDYAVSILFHHCLSILAPIYCLIIWSSKIIVGVHQLNPSLLFVSICLGYFTCIFPYNVPHKLINSCPPHTSSTPSHTNLSRA